MGGGGCEDAAGVCIILDHRKRKNNEDKTVAINLFKDVFGYQIEEIDIPENFENKKEQIHGQIKKIDERLCYSELVLFVFGECDPESINDYKATMVSKSVELQDYLGCFIFLSHIPKIIIHHMWHTSHPREKDGDNPGGPDAGINPFQNSIYVSSAIIDTTGKFSNYPALFFLSMKRIFSRFGSNCDIIELLTKVLRDVEITQAIKRRQHKAREDHNNKVAHEVTFRSHLQKHFKLVPCSNYKTRSKDSEISEHSSGDEVNPQALNQDQHQSRNKHFYLQPGQYDNLDTYSTFEFEKLPSMKIELKEQKLHDIQRYPMDNNPRGYCIVINMSNDRLGSILDEMRMCQMFKELYFHTFIINNRSHREIKDELKYLATSIPESIQCLFIILMGHGGLREKNKLKENTTSKTNGHNNGNGQADVPKTYVFQDIDGNPKSPDYLFKAFETVLSGKPKICVLQTCFGDGVMKGCTVSYGDADQDGKGDSTEPHRSDGPDANIEPQGVSNQEPPRTKNVVTGVPHAKSDWCRLNATIKGYKTYRTAVKGSYVIAALDKMFRKHAARSDLSQLMTMVTSEVSGRGKQGKGKWQQPECRTYFNGSLYLNPGYAKKEYPKLEMIDSPEGSYTTDDSKPVAGSVCWFSGEHIAVASNTSNEIKLATVQGDVQIDSLVNNHIKMRGINAGFMLTEEDTEKNIEEEHIIIYITDGTDGKQKMIVATFDKKNKTWSQRLDLTNSIENPLTICEINNDCFGVLRGNPNTHEDVTIEVYTREAIRQLVKEESNKKKARDNSFSPNQVPSESAMEQDNISTPLQTQLVIRVNYAKQTQISCRDQLCYARTKFYILSFHESTVYQVNVDGNIESFRNSFDSQPVSLLRGPDGTIDVTCCDAVYTGVFGHQMNRRLTDCYTRWSAGDHTIVVANGSGTLSLIPLRDGENEEITLDPTTPLCSGVFNIICGFMLSEDEHIIIYTIDGQQKIAAIKLDKENKSWSQIIDMTNTIVHPLAMCNIDKDSVGVLRGTPGAKQDITIERYAIKKFINKISESLQGTMKTQMSAEQTISVTISQPSKINFRDQIYHSQNKFFILSFDQSTLHVINDGGTILKSGAFTFLKGPIGSRHIACCNKSFRDYVAPEHIYIKKIRVASTASYMLNVSGKAFVADDPGLPHSSFALIPKFQPDSLKFHKTIEGFSDIMQQCVWSTNKSGVVAVGSAESCHISLVSGSKDSPVSVFMDEIQRPAKILQGIHLGDRTHLVMFQATPRVKILKYVRINPNNDKINIIGDVKPLENNTKEVEEVPVAVFAIDKVTFGIVYSINERYVEIKIYKRETNNAIKETDQEELETDLGHGTTDQGEKETGQGDEESNNEVDQRNTETDHEDQEAVQRNGGAEQENGITDQRHEKVDEGDEEINQGDMETIVSNGVKIRLAKTVKLSQYCVGNDNDSACVDKNGKFYISNYSQREVNSFDVNGLWIKKYEILLDGITLAPYRVMVDKENQVFILCQEAIYRLNSSEVFNFEAKFRLYSKQALKNTQQESKNGDQVKPEPKQSWDICFDGNLMYSVYEDTLDVYGP